MSSAQLLVWLMVAVGFGFAGWGIGKGKGRPALGAWLGFLLGLIGIIIIACIPKTQAAKLAEAQRQYQLQGGAAWNAGYPYPPPGQQPYPQQPPPGQWPEPPPPTSWE